MSTIAITLVFESTNMRPIVVKMGTKNPIELNSLRTKIFVNLSLRTIRSLTIPENRTANKHVKNGIEDNSPFFFVSIEMIKKIIVLDINI